MANYRNDFADVNLETGTICRNFMNHSIGSGDALGDRFGVRVFRNGEPVSLGGTVAGYFVRNTTGETVVISSGVVSVNEAYVTLPAACYAVEGSFTLAIKVTSGSETVTMRIVDGVVSRTNTSVTVDPGTLVPSIETLISAINSAVGQIPVNYNASFAPAYSASSTYAVGDYVVYDGYLWRCTTAITETESWTAAHWTKVALASDVSDLKSALNAVIEIPGENIIALTDFTEATRTSYVVDSVNNAISVTNTGNNTYDSLQTPATFIPTKCVPGRTYRLHAKAEKVTGNPALVVAIRGSSENDNGIASVMDLGSTGEGFFDFVADQYMKRVTLFVSYGSNTKDSVAKFSEIWLKEYNTTGIDNDGRAELNDLETEVNKIENLQSNPVSTTWVRGSIDDEGEEALATTRARSGFITVKKGEKLLVSHGSYYWQYSKYETDGTFVGKSSFSADWSQTDGEITNDDKDYKYRLVIRNTNGSTDVDVSSIDVSLSNQSVIVNVVLSNQQQISSISSVEFVTPPIVNICGGIEQNFYFQNMIMGFDTRKAFNIKANTNANNYDDFCRLSPAENASQSNKGFKIRFYPNNEQYMLLSDAITYNVVPKSSGSGLTKKILLIGDSLTFNQPLSKHLVDDLLADDVMSVSLIGTLGTAPYNREGRSGWSAHDYVSGYEHGDSFTNAFWNPSTSKFDFSYYMSNNSFTGVDYVFINLGTNVGEGNTAESVADDLEEMVTSIHAYDSNIRVGVWTPPPRALMGNGDLIDNDNTLLRVKAIINKFKGLTASRTYIVPAGINVDPYHDFPYETVNVSSRNSSFQMVVATDRTHPASAGYFKMADVIYNYIKYFGSLDAQ